MAKLKIITYPNPILRKKSLKVKNIDDPEIKELVLDMVETMKANNGIGLAAPQVGKSLRVCTLNFDGKTYILINPKIKSKSWSKYIEDEGCLSFPGTFYPIKRSKKVKVSAFDRKGDEIIIKAEGLFAKALQHEIDHLDGILMIDYANKKKANKNEKRPD